MTKFIADLCSNTNGDLPRTLELILRAKEVGCTAIKLQLFKETLFAPEFKKQREDIKKKQFPVKFLEDVSIYCKTIGIQFGCTPFYLDAVDELLPFVDFYKIGSYENQYEELIKKVVDTGFPWQLSTGMLKLINVRLFTQQKYIKKNPPKALFRCNSTYPAKPEECNINSINFCKNYLDGYKNKIGWSDHTGEPGVIYQAVNNGAEFIEFHLDLEDKKGYESEIGHCWTPSEISKVIRDVEIMKQCEFGNDQDYDKEARKWRTDNDGFRPLKIYREDLLNDN